MEKQLKLIKRFHEKFGVPILNSPNLIDESRYKFRYDLMKEEIDEYLEGAKNKDLENIAKELADILCTVYGTIL